MKHICRGGSRYAKCGRCGMERNIDEIQYCTVCVHMKDEEAEEYKTKVKQNQNEKCHKELVL